MQLKITKSKGRRVDVEPGVTLRITGDKLREESMRDEVSRILSRVVPRAVEKVTGEQLTIEESATGKSNDDGEEDDE